MDARLFAGTVLAYFYNHHLGRWPSRTLRRAFLEHSLGTCGKGTAVQMDCKFLQPRKIHLGERNIINFGCVLDGRRYAIRTGHDVSIGPEAAILTLGHDPQSLEFADKGGEVTIGDRAWICYRAIILPGVKIGEGAVVGAGAVVTNNVDPHAVVVGVPARKVADRTKDLAYQLNHNPFLL